MKLLLASRNEHKRAELERMLPGVQIETLPAGFQMPPEDGGSFAEIALAKARAAAAVGLPALGEDSGIEAEALGGAPGIHSARYAGAGDGNAADQANTAKLLREAPAGSGLRYVCAMALVDGTEERLFTGSCEGRMAAEPHGEGGFGYDPIFIPEQIADGRSMAELAPEQKDAISHRGAAVRQLAQHLGVAV